MRVHVVYRTTGSRNRKPRPPWFSKRTALASLLAAAEQADTRVDVTYVVDGGLAEGLADLVGDSPQVRVTAGRADRSMRRALDVALAVPAAEPTLLWIAEDDYLYHPTALRALARAADEVPEASHFTLYVPDDRALYARLRSQPQQTVPELPGGPRDVDGVRWRRAASTTSTVGVRSDTLREDVRQMRLCTWVGSPFDQATYTSLQGRAPYPWRHITRDLLPRPGLRGRVKVVAKPVLRSVVNVSAKAYRERGRVLVAPEHDLATHIEEGHVSPAHDWAAIARAHA